MTWAQRRSATIDVEYLMFSIGGTRLAAPVDRIAGILSTLPAVISGVADSVLYRGREIPLFMGDEIFQVGATSGKKPSAALVFRHGQRFYAVAVDSANDVLRVTPGDCLYRVPPEGEGPPTGRAWGYVQMGDSPILLVNPGPLRVH